MKIIKFYEQGFTPVYSDMIVLMGNQIHGISIIGSEIVVKAYRAKFMDNVMAKANLRFWYEDKIVRLAYKPPEIHRFPTGGHRAGLQVVMMNDQLIWGISGGSSGKGLSTIIRPQYSLPLTRRRQFRRLYAKNI